jgi:hypothetical protein
MPPDFPHEIHTEITFKAIRPDVTELTIVERDWTMGQMAVYSELGLHQTITKLEDSLKNKEMKTQMNADKNDKSTTKN